VQDLDRATLESYDLICFFDVIEHLDAPTAKKVLTDLLTWMKPDCKLAIGTPLWYLVQTHGEEGDLEPHLCGVPVTSLTDLAPALYNINKTYLVGTFILDKSSLAHIDKFEPTTDKSFDEAAGLALVNRHGLLIDNAWHTLTDPRPVPTVTPPPEPYRLRTIVENYKIVADIAVPPNYQFVGGSSSAKHLIPTVFGEAARPVNVLDIGFGTGNLGSVVKGHALSRDWEVDAIDGFYRTCCNVPLFESGIYRTVWHGLVQDLDRDTLASYDLICLFDVIEHLDAATAKEVLKNLLTWMKPDCKLAIGTPLWFLLQGHAEEGDLEPHLCGIPVTSLLKLSPSMYNISKHYLVGTFILDKGSLAHIDKFEPTSDRTFNEAAGRALVEQHGLLINDQWNTL
jgi:2-polyprenyl-3-methyl-5-hydroxy-6-metoxy-1,4-benzoquinol methylase